MAIPIFIVAGFLDAGKTTFIKDALQKDGFSEKGKTLVILCEEGEIELTKDLLDTYNAKHSFPTRRSSDLKSVV